MSFKLKEDVEGLRSSFDSSSLDKPLRADGKEDDRRPLDLAFWLLFFKRFGTLDERDNSTDLACSFLAFICLGGFPKLDSEEHRRLELLEQILLPPMSEIEA